DGRHYGGTRAQLQHRTSPPATAAFSGLDSPQQVTHAPLLLRQLLLQAIKFLLPRPNQLELPRDMPKRLAEDVRARGGVGVLRAPPLRSKCRARIFGFDQLLELVERQPEQLLQAQDLLEPLDIRLVVEAMLAAAPLVASRQQPDLLVIPHGARRRPHALGNLADPERNPRRGGHRASLAWASRTRMCASGMPAP